MSQELNMKITGFCGHYTDMQKWPVAKDNNIKTESGIVLICISIRQLMQSI